LNRLNHYLDKNKTDIDSYVSDIMSVLKV